MVFFETKGWVITKWEDELLVLFMKDWKREVKKYKQVRTDQQNKYLHWLFGAIANDMWNKWDPAYIKYIMKARFLTVHIYKEPHVLDTHNLSADDFWKFVDNILMLMQDLWHRYPTPEEWKSWKRFVD